MNLFLDNIPVLYEKLSSINGILLFVFVYIFNILLILPTLWLSLLAGFIYGTYLGSIVVFLSAFIGASLSFFISKKFFSQRIKKLISKFQKLSMLERVIEKGGLKLIILTRLSPIFPFSILNYFYGLNKISYKDFAIGLICILPGTYLYCSLGGLAKTINDINNIKTGNNILFSLISIVSTVFIIYFLAKYSNEILKENNEI